MPNPSSTQVLIVGGGTGGVAAALACARAGVRCILTEPTDWIGGQLTAQAVPPDENQWIETFGGTALYQSFRTKVRDWYRAHRRLTPAALAAPHLNPGGGWVSRLCFEPSVGHAVLADMLAQHADLITILTNLEPIACDVDGDRIRSVTFSPPPGGRGQGVGLSFSPSQREGAGGRALPSSSSSTPLTISAPYILDATELADLYPLANIEHMIGAEHTSDFAELHARTDRADPLDQQAISWCFALEHHPGKDFRRPAPARYAFWKNYVPQMTPGEAPWTGPLFSWTVPSHNQEGRRTFPFIPYPAECPPGVWDMWRYRRIRNAANELAPDVGPAPTDISLVNWVQMDYWIKPLLGVSADLQRQALEESRELSNCLIHWMQNDCPRHDDSGTGYPGLRPAGESLGTADGLAKAAYIREPRRLRARTIVTESHIGTQQRAAEKRDAHRLIPASAPPMGLAEPFPDSVGIGHYTLDLHPSTAGRNSVYVPAAPFRIPLGSLIPVRVRNLLAAGKGIGVTHITNGCYRMHAVEWNVGESAGALAAFCLARHTEPAAVHESPALRADFQKSLTDAGVRLAWPWES
jgi:hypothetical protein